MKKPPPNKQKELTAQSLKRIAKALRVRARNHKRAARAMVQAHAMHELTCANIYTGLAQDFDHEATTLRAMR